MKQYIDKSALVAWIENQIDSLERNSGCSGIFGDCQMAVFDRLYSFLDTLEVEEVDLEKEAENFVQTGEFVKNENPVLAIAKYFFELGLKAQKGGMIEALRTEYEKGRADVIEKACKFLKSYRQDTLDGAGYIAGIMNDKTIEDFRKAMEE